MGYLFQTDKQKSMESPKMNERQLRSFVLAAEKKSFSKAASASYISTPAFVQQINLLEESLGFSLFERTNRGITLTPSGELFYDASKTILSVYETACQNGLALAKRQEFALRIGCPPEQFPLFVMQACQLFRERCGFPPEFILSPLTEHLDGLRSGRFDLSIMAEPDEDSLMDLTFCPLGEDSYSFCMRSDHPLASKTVLDIEDLRAYPILCGRYDYLAQPFRKGLPQGLDIRLLPDSYNMAIHSMIQLSDELFVIHSHWKNCHGAMLQVIPSSLPAGRIGAVYRKETPALALILDCLRQCFDEGG